MGELDFRLLLRQLRSEPLRPELQAGLFEVFREWQKAKPTRSDGAIEPDSW